MNKNRFVKFLAASCAVFLCLAFIVKFAGPNILKQYISYGIGDCKTVPILCLQPDEKTLNPEPNREYADTLVPQKFPKMSLSAPKGFNLVQELIKKKYYKKRHPGNKAVIYLLRQEPGAFIRLYPDVRKQGVNNNYEFIRRLMYANINRINNLTDAFFVVMKSIFIPDLGQQNICRMIQFKMADKIGFINYSMAKPDNYFDCNVLDAKDNFFKVYVKDIGGHLDLNNVFAIISTLEPVD